MPHACPSFLPDPLHETGYQHTQSVIALLAAGAIDVFKKGTTRCDTWHHVPCMGGGVQGRVVGEGNIGVGLYQRTSHAPCAARQAVCATAWAQCTVCCVGAQAAVLWDAGYRQLNHTQE